MLFWNISAAIKALSLGLFRAKDHNAPSVIPSDPDTGVWRGKTVAWPCSAPDSTLVLVGRSARDRDTLTFKLASKNDFWLHVAGETGSHVVVRNPSGLTRLPRETLRSAATLSADHFKAH